MIHKIMKELNIESMSSHRDDSHKTCNHFLLQTGNINLSSAGSIQMWHFIRIHVSLFLYVFDNYGNLVSVSVFLFHGVFTQHNLFFHIDTHNQNDSIVKNYFIL